MFYSVFPPGRFPFPNRPAQAGLRPAALLLLSLGVGLAESGQAATVTFDFDTGTPALVSHQGLPVDQTAGGVTMHCTGPFSVQSDGSTGYTLSQFSGKYLVESSPSAILRLSFSQDLTNVTLGFATADFNQNEPATILRLTAFQNTNAIGTNSAAGLYPGETSNPFDTMPQGTLSFSSTRLFNAVEIRVAPNQPLAASSFLVDNVTVTPIPRLAIWRTRTNTTVISWPAIPGFDLQQCAVLNRTNWTAATNAIGTVGGQNQVLLAQPGGKSFYRLVQP